MRIGVLAPFKRIYLNNESEQGYVGGGEVTRYLIECLWKTCHEIVLVDPDTNIINMDRSSMEMFSSDPINDVKFIESDKNFNELFDILFVRNTNWLNILIMERKDAVKFKGIIKLMANAGRVIYVRDEPSKHFTWPGYAGFETIINYGSKVLLKEEGCLDVLSKKLDEAEILMCIPSVSDKETLKLRINNKTYKNLDLQVGLKHHFINLITASWNGWDRKRPDGALFGKSLIYVGSNRSHRLKNLNKYYHGLEMELHGNWELKIIKEVFGDLVTYTGRSKYGNLKNLYSRKKLSVIVPDSNVENLSFFTTRLWEILRYGSTFLMASEVNGGGFYGHLFDRWIISSKDEINDSVVNNWDAQVEAVDKITPTFKEMISMIKHLVDGG